MTNKLTLNLGHALYKTGDITQDQLRSALDSSTKTGNRIKDVLIQYGYITETILEKILSKKLNLPSLALHGVTINPNVVKLIPYALAERHSVIPVFNSGEVLTVATDDPLNYDSLMEIAEYTGKDIRTAFATLADIKDILGRYH
jgi:type IV pilus assembly protein PilB